MKPHHLVPIFILALAVPGYASAGTSQKGDCGCSHVQKTHVQKGAPKSARCGCGSTQKGKGHTITSKGIPQKSHVPIQKAVQKHGHHSKSGCSKGGCSSCCLAVIPAVLNGVDHIVTNAVGHFAALFACDSCGGSKSTYHGGSKSKSCGCDGSSKIGLPGIPPDPFMDDELQPPAIPSTEARIRVERRPIHRHVVRTSAVVPVLRAAPRTLTITSSAPLKQAKAKPAPAPAVRSISAERTKPLVPHNPLRAK